MSSHTNRLSKKPPSAGSFRHIVGVGLDNEDGHKRITKAEEFSVIGGSQTTHEMLTETLIKTSEDLKRKGKTIASAADEELSDLIRKNVPQI